MPTFMTTQKQTAANPTSVVGRRGRHTDDVAKFLSQVEQEAVRGVRGQSERALGAVALFLSLAAVDLGESGESDCHEGNGERPSDPISLTCGRSPPARANKVTMQVGRRVGVGRPAVKPAFGGFEVTRP
jgi:hypothetical protein